MKAIAPIFTALLLLVAALPVRAQIQTITNGGLENWGPLNGSNQGTPTNWGTTGSATLPTRIAGLVSGSNYAAMLQYGAGNLLAPSLSSTSNQFELSFVFAATDPGSATNRSLNLSISQGTGIALNFRTVQGTSGAGCLNLQAFNGAVWKDVAIDLLATSDLTAGAGGAGMNAYNFDLSVNFATSTWSLSYGLVGSSLTTVSGLNYFQTLSPSNLSYIAFIDSNAPTNTAYAIDNVSLLSIPEPSSLTLATLSLMSLLGLACRKTNQSNVYIK